jgi:hypothetical protein
MGGKSCVSRHRSSAETITSSWSQWGNAALLPRGKRRTRLSDQQLRSGSVLDVYLRILPEPAQRLVAELKHLSGAEIDVGPTEETIRRQAPDRARLPLILVDERTARIRFPGEVQRRALVHELLHLRRAWIDAAPRLRSTQPGDPMASRIANADQDLEHMLIVPTEIEWTPESREHWNQDYFDLADVSANHDPAAIRDNLLRFWCLIRVVLQPSPAEAGEGTPGGRVAYVRRSPRHHNVPSPTPPFVCAAPGSVVRGP